MLLMVPLELMNLVSYAQLKSFFFLFFPSEDKSKCFQSNNTNLGSNIRDRYYKLTRALLIDYAMYHNRVVDNCIDPWNEADR